MKNRKGFTLIELLAVILILGVIALIAIPSVNNVIRQSRMGANKTTAQEMVKAARTYYTTCQINGMKKLDGNRCYANFLTEAAGLDGGSALAVTGLDIKAELELTGEIPSTSELSRFEIDPDNGDVYIEFTKDGFYCANFTPKGEGALSTKTLADEVTCTEDTE